MVFTVSYHTTALLDKGRALRFAHGTSNGSGALFLFLHIAGIAPQAVLHRLWCPRRSPLRYGQQIPDVRFRDLTKSPEIVVREKGVSIHCWAKEAMAIWTWGRIVGRNGVQLGSCCW